MDKFELLPTEENLIKTMQDNILDRNKDLVMLYEMLFAQETSCAIAVDGRWGSGKTFFVKQMQMVINAMNPFAKIDDEKRNCIKNSIPFSKERKESSEYEIAVYFDAWENDDTQNPLISVIYEIAKQLGLEYMIEDKKFFKKALAIADVISGRSISSIREAFESDDPISELRKQIDAKKEIKEFLSQAMNEKGDRLVVFIDELDRCNPIFAVKLLEQIKHYLDDERITFVFSTNLQELQHTIRKYYGLEYDASRYFDRFFDLIIPLPPIDIEKYCEKLGLTDFYRFDLACKRVAKMFNFEMREIGRLYSQAKTAAYGPTHKKGRELPSLDGEGKWLILSYIVPLLIGLNKGNLDDYDSFVSGRNSKPLQDLFANEKDDSYLFNNLLSYDETFDDIDGKNTISKTELIERLYDAIFVETYLGDVYRREIGTFGFTKESKNFAIRCASMMSPFADFG